MADAPWSMEDNLLFQQLAFEIPDEVHDKWERIAHELSRAVTVEELRQRYTYLFRDLWLIERGQVTRQSYMVGQEAAGAAAGEGATGAAGGPARAPEIPWSEEEKAIVAQFAGENNGRIGPNEFPLLRVRLPHRTPAAIRGYLARNGQHFYEIGGAQGGDQGGAED